MSFTITPAQLHAIAGSRAKSHIVNNTVELANRYSDKFHLNTLNRMAMFIGQIAVESAYFSSVEENLNYSAKRMTQVWPSRFKTIASAKPYANNPKALAIKTYGSRMGNRKGTDDGWNYRGGGLKMVTGRDNHTEFNSWIHTIFPDAPDFVKNPERIREFPWAFMSAIWFWETNKVWKYADKNDVVGASKAINGGTIGLKDRQIMVAKAKKVLSKEISSTQVAKKPRKADPVLKEYQEKLNRIAAAKNKPAYDVGKVDGWHGDKTEKAVRAFQTDARIDVDGVLGPQTRGAIDAVIIKMEQIESEMSAPVAEQVAEIDYEEVDTTPAPIMDVPDRIKEQAEKPLMQSKTIFGVPLAVLYSAYNMFQERLSEYFGAFMDLDWRVHVAIVAVLCIFAIMIWRDRYASKKAAKEIVAVLHNKAGTDSIAPNPASYE